VSAAGGRPEVERQVLAGRARFLLPWAGALAAALGLAALGAAIAQLAPSPAGADALLPAVAAASGAVVGVAVLLLERRLLEPSRLAARLPAPDVDLALRHILAGHLVLWSLAAVPALLGFAQLLLGGPLRTHLLLCGVSVGTLAYLMPARARLEERAGSCLQRRS
jgi:hypothetical protein